MEKIYSSIIVFEPFVLFFVRVIYYSFLFSFLNSSSCTVIVLETFNPFLSNFPIHWSTKLSQQISPPLLHPSVYKFLLDSNGRSPPLLDYQKGGGGRLLRHKSVSRNFIEAVKHTKRQKREGWLSWKKKERERKRETREKS